MQQTIVQMLDFVPDQDRSMEVFLLSLAQKLRAERCRTVHVFAGEPSASFKFALKEVGSPYLVARFQPTVRDAISIGRRLRAYTPTCLQVTFMSKFSAVLPALKWAAGCRRLMVTDQSSGAAPNYDGLRRIAARGRGMLFNFYTDRVIAVSEFVRRRDTESLYISTRKTRLVYNGIDVKRFTPSPKPDAIPTIAFAGQLISEKGVDTLLLAARLLVQQGFTEFRLLIAGKGRQEQELRAFCRANGLHQVEFLGQIDWIPQLFASANVVVVPSVWEEAFGFVVAEAMACGACVIGSDAGGISEIVGPSGCSGLIFKRGDGADLAMKLKEGLANPRRCADMGRSGRQRVLEMFTIDHMVDQYLAVYRELLSRQHSFI